VEKQDFLEVRNPVRTPKKFTLGKTPENCVQEKATLYFPNIERFKDKISTISSSCEDIFIHFLILGTSWVDYR